MSSTLMGIQNSDDPTDPIVDPKTLRFRRSCKDSKEAYEMFRRLEYDNRERNAKMGAILQKYNDEAPYVQKKLSDAGQNWRNNRSTGFMGIMVTRMIPPYKQVIDSARYLTSTRFEDDYPEGSKKSESFQKNITKLVRSWDDFDPFNYRLVLENILFGYTAANWTDEDDWKPQFCRQDEALFPEGCLQNANKLPFWAKLQNFQIHEMAEYLIEPEVSASMGWNVDNVVKAINGAQPENRSVGTFSNDRKYEDLVRESSMGRSFTSGVKVIETVHMFVCEASGKISHYLLNKKNGDELMIRLDRFQSMAECLSLFSVEVGNDGRLHGSKGAGRRLYNTHVSLDHASNLFSDNLYLAGLLLLRASNKAKPIVALEVQHPIAVIPQEYEVVPTQIPINYEAFQALYTHVTSLAEMQVGVFMPGFAIQQTKEESASKTNYIASIEMQIKASILRRFFIQYSAMITQMQRRVCSPTNLRLAVQLHEQENAVGMRRIAKKLFDFMVYIGRKLTNTVPVAEDKYENQDAVDCCVNMLRDGLLPEEIFDLANRPSNELTENRIDDAAALQDVAATVGNSPNFNRAEFDKAFVAARLGNAAADRLLLDQQDNTIVQEATRLQMMELTSIMQGEPIPVSPRDVDSVHMDVIQQKSNEFLDTLSKAPIADSMALAENILGHYVGHLQGAKMKGFDNKKLESYNAWYENWAKLLSQAKTAITGAPQGMPPSPTDVMPAASAGHAGMNVKPPTKTELAVESMRELPQPGVGTNILPLSRGMINPNPIISEQHQ